MASTGNVEEVRTRWAPRERLSTPMPSEGYFDAREFVLTPSTYSPITTGEREKSLDLTFLEKSGHDHVISVDAEIVVANPQDVAPLKEVENSIPSRYNPEVDYESSPTIGKDDPDSPQNTWVVDEDAFDINTTTSVHALMINESTYDDDDATATKGQEVESVDKGGHIAAAKDDGILEVPDISGPMNHPASSDQVIGRRSRPTLVEHLVEIVKTSSYYNYPVIQEKATEYCRILSRRILSRFGVDVSSLEAHLQKLLKEAKVIQEVAAHPSYISSARVLKVKEHMNLVTKELVDYDSKSSSLIRAKEKASASLNQQHHKVEDLKKTFAQEKAKEVELSGEVDIINECILRLDSGKNEAVKKAKGVVDECKVAEDGHHAIEELNNLSNLIKDFECHCKGFHL